MNSSLNHVYRIIWNAALGLWQVASEATRGRGKTGSSQQARKARRALAAATAMTLASPAAWAVLPTGGNVVAGSATITQAGSALNINQGSDKAAINWQSFSIGQGNSVNFVQPSATSVALNRVLGNDVSVIQGAINANGQVFLVNQNGVLFTPTAQVNVGGIVASTQNISTADFIAGKYEFSGNSTATVENQGSITAANGGVVALVAAKVINSGTITAPQGTVGLAAGNTVLLDLGGPVKIQVTEGALNAAIEQSGGIRADGGTIYLTAKAAGNLAASVINHSGVTRALTMASLTGEPQGQTGSIALSADQINHTGTLDVSGLTVGQHGGDILAQGKHYTDSGTTLADGAAQGGDIDVRATNITQTQGAKVSASSSDGQGGRIEMIGDLGNGRAEFAGQILATGRRRGGFVDTSGAKLLIKDTLRVNTTSSEGQTGEWLLDPVDFTIAASGGDITGAALSAALQINNVTIQTLDSSVTCSVNNCGTGNTSGKGDIHVNDSITATNSGKTLTLQASRDINVNKAVKVDGLNLTAVGNVNVNDVVDVGSSLTVNYGASVSGSTFTPNTGVRLSDISSLNMKMTLDGFIGKINLGALANSAVINGNNYIIIKDRDGLLNISNNTASLANRYILANDIDLGASWTPIGIGVTGFSGSFEGLGHLAKNLNVTTPLSGFSGFFNAITNSASISNLGVVGDVSVSSGTAGGLVGTTGSAVDILLRNVYSKVNVSTAGTGSSNAGGLLGNATNGTLITNAIIVGQTVKSSSSSAGGVVGSFSAISGTRAKNVFSTANVEGAINAGGLFGAIVNNSTSGSVNISNVYATGNVIGGNTANTRAGGLIGQANSNGVSSTIIIDNAFASGKVSTIAANALRGGLVGFIGSAAGANISISNAYWDSAKSEQSAVSGSTVGLTTTNVNDVRIGNPATLFPNLNSNVWAVVNGTPTLKVFQSAPSIQQVFIRLACGTLCFNTYGDTLPTFVFDDFAAANGTTALTNATLTGTATFNVTDANNNAVSGFNSLSNAGTYKFVYTGGLMTSGFELVAGDAVTWTVVPRALTVTTNNFLNSATDAITVASSTPLVAGQTFTGLNLSDTHELTAVFGQNTLASNYATTVVVPGATGSDLTVNRDLTVNGVNLTLQSDKNIVLRKTVTAQGANDKVTLNYGQGADAANNTADYNFGLSPDGFAGKLNLQAGQNFSTKLGSDGSVINYTVITALGEQGSMTGTDLQGINGNLAGKFALGADIDAASTAQWNGGLGFDGIGDGDTGFSGRFTGLGHRVIGLTINRPEETSIGLFQILKGATLRDIGVVDASIAGLGDTGVLAGSGSIVQIRQVYSSGSVNAGSNAGGLIGVLRLGGSVKQAFSHSSVTGGSGGVIGGLVGSIGGRFDITLSEVFATGAIKSLSGEVGGLVGRFDASGGAMLLSDAYATGAVTGTTRVGGLIGRLGQIRSGSITIANTYAIGLATATSDDVVGGLIGTDVARTVNLNNSFWDTVTTGKTNGIGDRSNSGTGPVGKTTAELKTVATYTSAGWDISGNGGAYPVLTFDGGKIWRSGALITPLFIRLNCGILCNNTYGDNVTLNFNGFDMTAGTTPVSNATFNGTATYNVLKDNTVIGTTLDSMTDAGTYKIAYAGGLMADGFALSAGDAVTWTVVRRPITATLQGTTANPLTKVYDGSDILALTGANVVLGNFAPGTNHGATVTLTSGKFNSKDVVTAKVVTASLSTSSYSFTGDAKANNYQLPFSASKEANITPKALTIFGSTVTDKVYNGELAASVTAGALNGLVTVGGRTEILGTTTATGLFTSKDVARDTTGKVISQDVAVTYALVNGPASVKEVACGPNQCGPGGNGSGGLTMNVAVPGDLASNYTLANETLKGSIAQKAVTVAGIVAEGKTYDGNTTAKLTSQGTVATGIEGETLTVATTGSFNDKNAGERKVNTITTIATNGTTLASNYTLSNASNSVDATIAQKAVSVAGIAAKGKTYDGNTTAELTNQGTVATGIDGETLTVATTGSFNDKNAGDRKVNTLTTIANNGTTLASNYSLSNSKGLVNATIAQKAVSIVGIVANGKTYDGNTTATLSNQGTVATGISGESLAVTTTGSFNDKNAGARKVNTTTTIATNGTTLASNYTLSNATNAVDATIAQKAVSVAGIAAKGKTYDGNTTAELTNQGTVATGIDGETLTVATTGSFDKKNAGARKVNTLTTIANNGTTLASNYTLNNTSNSVDATIAQKALTIAATAMDKVYDGKSTATATLSTKDVLGKDEVTLNQTAANFINAKQENDKNVGQNKTVRVTGLSLTGGDAANYLLTNGEESADTTANLTAKSLTIAATASDKVYNASTTADVTLSTKDMVSGDTLTLNKKVANFDTKNVGTGKTVTVEGLSLGGADAGNYAISNANAKATDTADISKAALSVSGITAENKTYDGTANATVSTAKAQLKGLFDGDKLSVSATGSFADKTAATGKTVTLSSSYSGADVDNYTITDQAKTTADISKLGGVKVIADKQSKTVGAADPKLTFTVTGLLAGDALAGSLAREPGEAAGLYDIKQGSLANENYLIDGFTPAQLTISQPIADVAIANAQTLEPKLDLQIEREALEERSGDIAPFIIAANQPRAGGPAQLIVVNGGIRLPAGQQEEN